MSTSPQQTELIDKPKPVDTRTPAEIARHQEINRKRTRECQSCKAPIIFLRSNSSGRLIPTDAKTVTDDQTIFDRWSGHIAHFATCPDAARFRTPRNPICKDRS